MSNIIERVLHTNIYIQPLLFLLVAITNTLNIRILCCRLLRSSPCSHYFLAYAILSIVYTCLLCPVQFLRAFSINLAHGKIACKIHAYFLFVIPLQANTMLILALFDRYRSSSQLRVLYSTSTIRKARRNIMFGALFCIVYMIPMLFIYTWNQNSEKCLVKFNRIINIYVFSQFMIYYILSPSLMVLFGILTICNIRQQLTRSIPIILATRRRRTEVQLVRMLFLQVGVHLIFVLPFGIIYSINSFVPSTQTPTIIAIRLVFVTWQQCDCFASFFLYVLSASDYRQQLVQILKSVKSSNRKVQYFVQSQTVKCRELRMVKTNIESIESTFV